MEKILDKKGNKGFTLIEILVVLTIMSILAIVVLVGLKPAQRLAAARDARRAQDIGQILTGVHSCVIDKNDTASMATCLGSTTVNDTYEIVTGSISTGCNAVCTGATSASSCLALDGTLSDYFVTLPKDPAGVVSGHTGYSLKRYSNGMIVIEACAAENGAIKVSQ